MKNLLHSILNFFIILIISFISSFSLVSCDTSPTISRVFSSSLGTLLSYTIYQRNISEIYYIYGNKEVVLCDFENGANELYTMPYERYEEIGKPKEITGTCKVLKLNHLQNYLNQLDCDYEFEARKDPNDTRFKNSWYTSTGESVGFYQVEAGTYYVYSNKLNCYVKFRCNYTFKKLKEITLKEKKSTFLITYYKTADSEKPLTREVPKSDITLIEYAT